MHLVVVGVNHATASVELREKLAVGHADLAAALATLKSDARMCEACILSTCNRTEVYAVTRSRTDDDLIFSFLADYGGVGREELDKCAYRLAGHHAAKHLFEVACGLDSMALGETQVLRQIKDAYCAADGYSATGSILNALFQQGMAVGKRARTETAISTGAFSIGAAAAQLAKLVFANLKGRKALLLGAGEMSKLAAAHLKSGGVEKIYITNRTRANAEPLAAQLGAEVIDFGRFEDALAEVDVVISSTGSRKPIITKKRVELAMSGRGHSPLFLIDIAVPRDVEPEVAEIEGVFVYNIDDLQFLVDRCRGEREAEVEKVRAIIDEEVAGFMAYLRTLEAVPLIKQLREKFESVYLSEWDRCSGKLDRLSEEDRECVRRAIKSTVNKLTHDPILKMKDYAANGGAEKLDVARELFGLEPEEKQTSGS